MEYTVAFGDYSSDFEEGFSTESLAREFISELDSDCYWRLYSPEGIILDDVYAR